jgi:hypothetical protein
MRWTWTAAAAALLLAAGAVPAAEPIPLKVLYAGDPGSARAKDFTAFLTDHFAKLTATDLGKFKEEEARDYDVVIFDWTSIYPRDKDGKIDNGSNNFKSPPAPHLSQQFAKPAVLIGAAGGDVAGSLQLKINWL